MSSISNVSLSQDQLSPFFRIPNELWIHISEYVDPITLLGFSAISQSFRALSQDNAFQKIVARKLEFPCQGLDDETVHTRREWLKKRIELEKTTLIFLHKFHANLDIQHLPFLEALSKTKQFLESHKAIFYTGFIHQSMEMSPGTMVRNATVKDLYSKDWYPRDLPTKYYKDLENTEFFYHRAPVRDNYIKRCPLIFSHSTSLAIKVLNAHPYTPEGLNDPAVEPLVTRIYRSLSKPVQENIEVILAYLSKHPDHPKNYMKHLNQAFLIENPQLVERIVASYPKTFQYLPKELQTEQIRAISERLETINRTSISQLDPNNPHDYARLLSFFQTDINTEYRAQLVSPEALNHLDLAFHFIKKGNCTLYPPALISNQAHIKKAIKLNPYFYESLPDNLKRDVDLIKCYLQSAAFWKKVPNYFSIMLQHQPETQKEIAIWILESQYAVPLVQQLINMYTGDAEVALLVAEYYPEFFGQISENLRDNFAFATKALKKTALACWCNRVRIKEDIFSHLSDRLKKDMEIIRLTNEMDSAVLLTLSKDPLSFGAECRNPQTTTTSAVINFISKAISNLML